MGPEIKKLGKSIDRLNRSGGLVKAELDFDMPDEPEPAPEDMAMRRIDFACHPDEPVKVLDDWQRPVHCLICGTRV